MFIVAMYFKYLLLPQCQPNDLVILDGASYWKCLAVRALHAALCSRPSLPLLSLIPPCPHICPDRLAWHGARGRAEARVLLRPIFRAAQVNVLYLPPRSPT